MAQVRQRSTSSSNSITTNDSKSHIPDDKESAVIPIPFAIGGTIWFLGLCTTVSVLTETYYELLVAFGIHYLVFLFQAWPFQSEKYYDFTGMTTFVSVDLFSFLYRQQSVYHLRNALLSAMVLCWTLRLGSFLFWRILQHQGTDVRFKSFRRSFPRFLMVWTMSGQWVYFCTMPILIVNKNTFVSTISNQDVIGWLLFVIGFSIEILSDHQKTVFKSDAKNKGKFIRSGLWKWSRHPNYFGEIVLWTGIALSASSVIQHVTDWSVLVSPFWTIMLLVFMSGIPESEKTFKQKYKNVEGFAEYMNSTPVLIPLCICWR